MWLGMSINRIKGTTLQSYSTPNLNQSEYIPTMNILSGVVYDMFVIVHKNALLDLKSPFQLLGEFLMPMQICVVIYFVHYDKNPIISMLFSSLLPFYLGNLSSSLVRKFSVYFITEREDKYGMYQRVLGISTSGYFLGNLLYTYIFTTLVISPVWLILTYYSPQFVLVYYFASYVVCGNCFLLMMISFFKDPKVCSEVVGMFCSLSVFLYYLVDLKDMKWYSYPIMMLPQPGFALSVVGSSKEASVMMLLSAKFFIVIYAWREFEIHPLAHCKKCLAKLRTSAEDMNEEIELESLDSQAKIMSRLLSIRHLTKNYKGFVALDNLSLTIVKGQILALLGRNGAGKTTLIDIITGMQKPTEGSIEFSDPDNVKIGVCYQQQILYEEMSVEEIVKFYIMVRRESEEELLRVLTQVELYEEKAKRIKDLSGGMKRRLSLAIAIIGNPPILILDEPTSGLDPHSRRAVWDIINKLKAQQKSIFLTTHHLDEAEALSDRVCVIERGTSLVLGSPMFIKKKFGVGYILTVYGPSKHQKEQEAIIGKYVAIECQVLDPTTRKYTLRMKDEEKFGGIIKELEDVEEIEVTLQLNSLEEAFMGILNDPELVVRPSGHDNSRIIIPLERSPVVKSRKFRASLLKNLFLLRRNPLKSLILYNLNLLFLMVGVVVANIFKHITQSNIDLPNTDDIAKEAALAMKKIMLLQGYYFSIGVYINNAVYEKQKKIINVLRVRGLDWVNYWLPQFFLDFTFFMSNLLVLYLIVGNLFSFWFVAMFGLALILYCYCCSFLFSSSTRATKYFPLVNFGFGFLLPLVNLMDESAVKGFFLGLLKYTYPFYPIQENLMPYSVSGDNRSPLVYPFVVQVIIYLCILAAIQMRIVCRLKNKQEGERVEEAIKLKDVDKFYGDQQVLRSLSLAVRPQEILGLLGPNGAGKSTSFKLMTNLEQPSQGEIYLEHQKHFPYNTTFQTSGVCYQEDTLWESLTGHQILTIFGHLTGLQDINEEARYLADRLEIQTLDRKFEKLSGGNKRKFCMAVCLMGKPSCAYLDECSTGLDPMSRRSMVKLIGLHREASIVFTTHSMNEAQNLCNRIAILINGSLKEYGTTKQLKDKYHPSYFIEILYSEDSPSVSDNIKEAIPDLSQRSHLLQERKIYCGIPKSSIRLSELYFKLMELKQKQVLADFSVYEPNLEDIYLKIINQ